MGVNPQVALVLLDKVMVSNHYFVGEMFKKTSADRRLKESKSHFLWARTG